MDGCFPRVSRASVKRFSAPARVEIVQTRVTLHRSVVARFSGRNFRLTKLTFRKAWRLSISLLFSRDGGGGNWGRFAMAEGWKPLNAARATRVAGVAMVLPRSLRGRGEAIRKPQIALNNRNVVRHRIAGYLKYSTGDFQSVTATRFRWRRKQQRPK